MDFKGIGFNHSISAAKSFESLNIRQMAIETRDAELLAVLCRSGELDILELDDELAKLTMVQIANGAGLDLEDYSIYNFKNDHKMKNLIAKVFGGHNSELKLYLLSLGAQVPIKLLDSQPHLVQSIMIRGLSQDRKHLEFLVKQFWYEWIRNSNFDGFLCSVLTSSIAAMNDELQDVIVVLTVVMLLDMPKNGAILLLGASIGSKRSNIMRMLKLPVFTSLSLCQNDPMLLEILKSFQKKLDMMPVQISTRPVALVSSSSARDLLFDLVRGVCICGIDTDTKNVSLETLNIAIWCARLDLYRNCADLDQFTRSIPTIPERLVFPVTKFLINLHNQGFYPDYILMNLFPKLCALKDPYCINEMYKVVKANYLSPEFNDMRMGLIAAHKLWTTDKRVSNELVTAIFQIHQRLKSEYDHKDLDGDQIQPFGLLEISLSNIVADICDNDPFFCGKQLLPLIVPSIAISDRRPKELRTVEQELISNFFKSYVLLCEHDVIDLQTGWESVLKSYWDFNLQSDSVLIQFLKYFKLVMDKLNAVRELSDSEISFKDMIIGCIEKLLVHASETVSQAAYEALSQGMAADTESLLKYLTPESVHGNLHKLEKFLVHKIAAEIKQMSRPVFKGFSIEQGGKRRDNIIALDSNIIDGSNIIANMVQLYVNDSARRTVLAPIILYSRPTTISEALIIELCENIVYTDGIEVIDTINGWIYLFENYLTLKSDIVVTEFCTALVMHVDSLNSPKLICSFLLALTSLLLSASNLQYAIAANLMSKILDFFDNRMDITSYDSVREHSSLCVALLSKISLNTAILSKAIKICLESPDSFVRGYTCAVVAADGLLFDYTVSNFIETCYVHHEWISEGSAIGYATLLGAYHQFKPEKPAVATITKDAYDALGAYIAGKDIPAKAVINSIWIASHCSSHESNFAPLIAKSLSHSLEKVFRNN